MSVAIEVKMTKREMAVAIAKDVIAQLKKRNNKMIPLEKNGYLRSDYKLDYEEKQKDLQSLLPKILKSECYVCARGAAVISKARLFNDVPACQLDTFSGLVLDCDTTTEILSSAFTEKTLNDIEDCFELTLPFIQDANKNKKTIASGLVAFGAQYKDNKKRLIAIMQNIIDNNGVMVVPKVSYNEAYKIKYKDS